jgi:TPP-dependent pyruvate/acetoin dehydrogenase alpha subunit
VSNVIYSNDELLELYRQLCLIRQFELRCAALFREGRIRGSMHLYEGQEAVAVGACSVLEPQDALSFTYRSHGWALARGITPDRVFAECFGRASGCAKGRGGSKHLGDWGRRILPSNAIVAGGIPLALGVAFAARFRSSDDVTIAVLGDGALNQGVVHESISLALVWKLPVVFVCENNQYAELTPVAEFQPVKDLTSRAEASGLAGTKCDGMDVEEVADAVGRAVARARSGGGPSFVEAETYRFCGHMTGDQERYRSPEEVALWRQRDPISIARAALHGRAVGEAALDRVWGDVAVTLAEAEQVASNAPEPDPSSIFDGTPSWRS